MNLSESRPTLTSALIVLRKTNKIAIFAYFVHVFETFMRLTRSTLSPEQNHALQENKCHRQVVVVRCPFREEHLVAHQKKFLVSMPPWRRHPCPILSCPVASVPYPPPYTGLNGYLG